MESMSRVASEVAADFPEHKIYEHSIRVDYPTSINPTEESRHIVFMRKEA
jgi:hypothetical protein